MQVEVQTGYLQADSADKQVKDIALPYQRRLLLKSLLRAVALASYAPSTGTAARPGVC